MTKGLVEAIIKLRKMKKTAINLDFLPAPQASFNRAIEIGLGRFKLLFISGTASVGAKRQTMYRGNFQAQTRHTYKNIKDILDSRGLKIKDVVSWRVYLKDIGKYYRVFNRIRDSFFKENKVSRMNMGSSTCVEAKLCRKDLLVEIEAMALKEKQR